MIPRLLKLLKLLLKLLVKLLKPRCRMIRVVLWQIHRAIPQTKVVTNALVSPRTPRKHVVPTD